MTAESMNAWEKPGPNLHYFAAMIRTVRNGPNRAVAARFSDPELTAIIGYRTLDYIPINETLRGKRGADALRDMASHIQFLKASLAKLPDHVGTVHRIAHLSLPSLAEHRPGAIVTEPAFLITARPDVDKNRSADARWSGRSNVWYTIHSQHGKDISGVAANDREYEVLFLPGSRFRVSRVADVSPPGQPHTRTEITMDEL